MAQYKHLTQMVHIAYVVVVMQTLRVQAHDELMRWFRTMAGRYVSMRDALEGGVVTDPCLSAHVGVYHCSVLDAILFYKRNTYESLCHGVDITNQVLACRIPASTRSQEKYDQRVLCLQALGEMWLRWFEIMGALAKHPPTLFSWMMPCPDFLEAQMLRSVEELKRLRAWRAFGKMRSEIAEYIDAWIEYMTAWFRLDV